MGFMSGLFMASLRSGFLCVRFGVRVRVRCFMRVLPVLCVLWCFMFYAFIFVFYGCFKLFYSCVYGFIPRFMHVL
jgi:hypothetical protein